MIDEKKEEAALLAIHAVLVLARAMAYNKAPHEEIAAVLDDAELLPMLILRNTDQTEFFRMMLKGLAERFPGFGGALDAFDLNREQLDSFLGRKPGKIRGAG